MLHAAQPITGRPGSQIWHPESNPDPADWTQVMPDLLNVPTPPLGAAIEETAPERIAPR